MFVEILRPFLSHMGVVALLIVVIVLLAVWWCGDKG